MNLNFTLIVFVLLISGSLPSQTHVPGRVTEYDGSTPVIGVVLYCITHHTVSTASDLNGYFHWEMTNDYPHEIYVNYTGFPALFISMEEPADSLNIRMAAPVEFSTEQIINWQEYLKTHTEPADSIKEYADQYWQYIKTLDAERDSMYYLSRKH